MLWALLLSDHLPRLSSQARVSLRQRLPVPFLSSSYLRPPPPSEKTSPSALDLHHGSSQPSLAVKNLPARCGFDPWVVRIPWRGAWQRTPVLLPGESRGRRGLGGCGPQRRRDSPRRKQLSTHPCTRMGIPLSLSSPSVLLLLKTLFVYFWLHWAFSAACGLSRVAVSGRCSPVGLLAAVASLVGEHRL